MTIKRDDEKADFLAPHLLFLWSNKMWIISVFIITFIVSFITLRFVKNEYEVTANLYVNRMNLTESGPPSPASVAKLLENPMLLEKVKLDYVKEFQYEDELPIEKFAKQFKTQTEILQDTTVRKDLSPIIKMTVGSVGTSETKFLMDRWIHHTIAEYGSYATQESINKLQILETESTKIEKKLSELEKENAVINSKIPFVKRKLAEQLESLSPARLNSAMEPENNIDIRIESNTREGLIARKTELEIELKAGTAGSTAPKILAAIIEKIGEIEKNTIVTEQELSKLYEELSRNNRETKTVTESYTALRSNLNKFLPTAALYEINNNDKRPYGTDISLLSSPVMPEKKVWPPRSVLSGIIAVLVTIVNIISLFVLQYFQKISTPKRNEKL